MSDERFSDKNIMLRDHISNFINKNDISSKPDFSYLFFRLSDQGCRGRASATVYQVPAVCKFAGDDCLLSDRWPKGFSKDTKGLPTSNL